MTFIVPPGAKPIFFEEEEGPEKPLADLPNTLGRPRTITLPNKPPKPSPETVGIRVPRPEINRGPRTPPNIRVNLAGADAPIPRVYGRARVVGKPVIMRGADQAASGFVFVYVFCDGEIEAFEKVFIDNSEIDLTGKSPETTYSDATDILGGTGAYQFFVGNATQDLSAFIGTVNLLGTDYNDAPKNVAMLAFNIRATRVSGLPRVEAIIQGYKGISDPRTSPATVDYTANPALCLANLIDDEWGSKTVDTTSLATAADACDEDVDGNTRRVIGMTLDGSREVSDWVRLLSVYAGVFVWLEGNTVYLVPDRPADPVMDITEAHILPGTFSAKRLSIGQRPDDVRVIWFDVDNNTDRSVDALGTTSGRISSVNLPGVTNLSQAKREAIERLNHLLLEDLSIGFRMRDQGLKLQIGDVIKVTYANAGIADKPMRVVRLRPVDLGTWEIECTEYDPGAYSDQVQTDPYTPDTSLDNPFEPPTPSIPDTNSFPVIVQTDDSPPASVITTRWGVVVADPGNQTIRLVRLRIYDDDSSPYSSNLIYDNAIRWEPSGGTMTIYTPPLEEPTGNVHTAVVNFISSTGTESADGIAGLVDFAP